MPQPYGFLIETTNIWQDAANIPSIDVESEEFKDLLVRLYQNIGNIAYQINLRDAGYYDTMEFLNSQLFFPNPVLTADATTPPSYRAVYRKVINFGALPNAGTKNVAHGITCTAKTSFTRIYGCASDPVAFSYLPLPYASPTAANEIELSVDGTNVSITTGSNRTAYTITYIILEYLQS